MRYDSYSLHSVQFRTETDTSGFTFGLHLLFFPIEAGLFNRQIPMLAGSLLWTWFPSLVLFLTHLLLESQRKIDYLRPGIFLSPSSHAIHIWCGGVSEVYFAFLLLALYRNWIVWRFCNFIINAWTGWSAPLIWIVAGTFDCVCTFLVTILNSDLNAPLLLSNGNWVIHLLNIGTHRSFKSNDHGVLYSGSSCAEGDVIVNVFTLVSLGFS